MTDTAVKTERPQLGAPNSRTWLFLYTTLWLVILVAFGAWFVGSDRNGSLFAGFDQIRYGLISIWFAMLGGVAISYKGIVDHRDASQWGVGWDIWYLARPFASFVVGVVTLALLSVVNTSSLPSIPALAVASFTFGTQDRRFFAFLYQVAKLVLNTPHGTDGDLQITALSPATGGPNTVLIIEGDAFQKGATVTIGGIQVASTTVASEGTSIAVVVPAGLPAGDLSVVVLNPDNHAERSATSFKYTP